jgi:hypothetical protein
MVLGAELRQVSGYKNPVRLGGACRQTTKGSNSLASWFI